MKQKHSILLAKLKQKRGKKKTKILKNIFLSYYKATWILNELIQRGYKQTNESNRN